MKQGPTSVSVTALIRPALVLIAVCVLLSASYAVRWGFSALDEAFAPSYERFESVPLGLTDKGVLEMLGEPVRIWHRETAPSDYYLPGYAYRQRAITNKVFIYTEGEAVAYFYFDETDRVEEVFVGGS